MSGETAKRVANGVRRFKPYPAYKESGVERLGAIPAHWEIRHLKHLTSLNSESLPEDTDPGLEMVYVDIGGVDSLGQIVERESLSFASAPSRARRLVRNGDVIVSTVRTYLRAIAPIKNPEPNLVVSTGFAVVRPHNGLTFDYAAYALRAPYFVERVVANSKGVSFPAINESEMAVYELAVPPLDEQRAIAAFLDREIARIDALVAKKERVIELLQEKRAALITRAVTKGLNPTVRMRDSGVKWLGKIPAHWKLLKIKFIAANAKGSFTDGDWIESPFITSSGVRLLQCGNVGTGTFEEQGFRYISFDTFREFRCSEVIPGDILICRLRSSPTILAARACLAPELGVRMITSVDNCILKPSQEHDARYLVYQMSLPGYLKFVEEIARGGTRDRISRSMLADFKFVTPPRFEQCQIADSLNRETGRIDTVIAKVRDAIGQIRELRTALVSEAVTGKIDVREEAA